MTRSASRSRRGRGGQRRHGRTASVECRWRWCRWATRPGETTSASARCVDHAAQLLAHGHLEAAAAGSSGRHPRFCSRVHPASEATSLRSSTFSGCSTRGSHSSNLPELPSARRNWIAIHFALRIISILRDSDESTRTPPCVRCPFHVFNRGGVWAVERHLLRNY